MTAAHGFTELLGALGVDRSYSRPRVSNDNPTRNRINRLEPEPQPLSADRILHARDSELASLWTPALRRSTTPVINLPGPHSVGPGEDLHQPFST